jgi:TRAP transporter 4TM/12TM fusion protein
MTAQNSADDEITPEETDELLEEIERRRSLRGGLAVAVATIGILFSIFQLFLAAQGFEFGFTLPLLGSFEFSLQLLQANAVHVGFALVLTFLMFPGSTGDGFLSRRLGRIRPAVRTRFGADNPLTRAVDAVRRPVRWAFLDPDRDRVTPFDIVCIVVAVLAATYHLTEFREIRDMRVFGLESGRTVSEIYPFLEPVLGGLPIVSEHSYAFILGVLGILLVLEATRRALGWQLMVLVALFIVYARWGNLIALDTPVIGVLSIPELTWPSIVQNLWYNTENGVFGIPVTVSVQFIYIFILFGAFLEMSGAGQWFIDLAYSLTGERRGGPAKASVLASGFMGTISGSSIANTVTTGAFTIPLMKRSGYSPEFAGAVEASASSGGQILPPVMGAAAFLMVQYTGTPFRQIIILATIPAIVFFFGVWVMIHLKAVQEGIGGVPRSELVDLREHMKYGWFYLVPIFFLLYFLIIERLSVARSAWFTLVALMALIAVVGAYSRETRIPLAVAIVTIFLAEYLAYLVFGVGLPGVVQGQVGAGVAAGQALDIVLGNVGWYLIAAGVVVMLYRPRVMAPLLSLDPTVQKSIDGITEWTGREKLRDMQLFRFSTFTLKSMDEGARTAVPVVIAVAAAGIIPGVISVTGLGPNLTSLILNLAGGSIVILLIVTAIASIILGMGMPTTVTYIILVSMLAPPLIEAGLPQLASHLFILYFGVIADITPPVAVAAYAASGVAKSDPFETGVKAFSLSLNKAIVPFAFAFVPGIVLLRIKDNAAELPPIDQYRVIGFADLAELSYSVPEIFIPVIGVFLGVVALGATVIGTLYTSVSRAERAAFAVSSVLLMAPALLSVSVVDFLAFFGTDITVGNPILLDLSLRAVGLILFLGLVARNRRDAGDESLEPEESEESTEPVSS